MMTWESEKKISLNLYLYLFINRISLFIIVNMTQVSSALNT